MYCTCTPYQCIRHAASCCCFLNRHIFFSTRRRNLAAEAVAEARARLTSSSGTGPSSALERVVSLRRSFSPDKPPTTVLARVASSSAHNPAHHHEGSGGRSSLRFVDRDEHVYFWFPLLAGLSELTFDPRWVRCTFWNLWLLLLARLSAGCPRWGVGHCPGCKAGDGCMCSVAQYRSTSPFINFPIEPPLKHI